MLTALVAFPSEIWCAGAKALLSSCGWEVVGTVDSSQAAIDVMAQQPVGLLVIAKGLLDGGPGPLAAVHSGKIAIVLEDGATISPGDFAEWQVEGLILSTASKLAFQECFDDLRHNAHWIDPDIRKVLVRAHTSPPDLPLGRLSEREQEVAQLAAEGYSNKQIARAMGISDGTIKMHMHHILTKFHLTSRIELVRLAQGAGAASETPQAAHGRPALRVIDGLGKAAGSYPADV